jgi:uncharacterized protein (DUF305 family)
VEVISVTHYWPHHQGAIDLYKAKLQAGNDADKIAADLAAKDLERRPRART